MWRNSPKPFFRQLRNRVCRCYGAMAMGPALFAWLGIQIALGSGSGSTGVSGPRSHPNSAPSVVFVDQAITGAEILRLGVLPGNLLVMLDPDGDELSQITTELTRIAGQIGVVGTVHIVSHGAPGRIRLGSQSIATESLLTRAGELAKWKRSLSASAEILLYGCETGAGDAGNAYLHQWASLTGAKVAASTNRTGASRMGGDWVLEATTGPVSSRAVFDAVAEQSLPVALSDFMFYHDGTAGKLIKANLDGSSPVNLLSYNGSVSVNAGDSAAVDPIHNVLYYLQVFAGANRGLYKTDFSGATPTRISPNTTNAVSGLAVDYVNSKIYFHDDTLGVWYRENLDGTSPQALLTMSGFGSYAAVDMVHSAVYYVNPRATPLTGTQGLYKTDLAMSGAGTRVSSGTNAIYGIAVDQANSKIYFSDVTAGQIIKADLDGSNPSNVKAFSAGAFPVHLVLDPVNTRIYFYSQPSGTTRGIYRTGANYDFSSAVQVTTAGNLAGMPGITPYFISPPSISCVTGPSAGSYHAGDSLDFTVTYSAAVDVTGTPYLPLTVGSSPVSAAYVSGTGTTTLVFRYTVQAGETDSNGITSSSPLVLNSGTIVKSATATAADLTFTPPITTSVLVDTTAPTISIASPSASITASGPVSYTVTYSDANFSSSTLSTGEITVNSTGTASAASVAITGSGTTRTVTLSSIAGDGTLGLSIGAGTATDVAGNLAASTGPSTTFTVDNTAPSISIGSPSTSITAGGSVSYTVTYSDANFSSSTLSAGNITVNSTGSASAGSVVVSGSGTTRTVTLSGIGGDGTLGISIGAGTASDTAGNTAAAAGPSATFTVDNTAPTIDIGSPSPGTTSSGPVTFTVSYADAHFNASTLSVGDIALHRTGTATGLIGVTGSGTTRTVTISSITGLGTIGISIASATASDTAGNLAPSTALSTTFTVQSAPSVTTLAATSITLTGATLNATINPNGLTTTASFESGTDTNYGTRSVITFSPDNGTNDQSPTDVLTGLAPATTYHFRAVATNSAGVTSGTDLIFTTATNLGAPTAINLSNNSVAENEPPGRLVGTLTDSDPDAGDTAAFALVNGSGSTDNASFQIVSNQLQTTASFDYETKNSYSVRIEVTDSGGLTFEQAFVINVSNVNEPPVFNGYSLTVAKDTASSVLVAKLIAKTTDPENDTRSVSSVGATSAQGGTVLLAGSVIKYTPPGGYIGGDSFSVVFSDGSLTTTGFVSVNVGVAAGTGPALISITAVGSDVQLKFSGIPGHQYAIQRSTSLIAPVVWDTLSTVTANASGFVLYTDPSPPSPSYWRTLNNP